MVFTPAVEEINTDNKSGCHQRVWLEGAADFNREWQDEIIRQRDQRRPWICHPAHQVEEGNSRREPEERLPNAGNSDILAAGQEVGIADDGFDDRRFIFADRVRK